MAKTEPRGGQIKDDTLTAADMAAANKDGLASVVSMRKLGTGAQEAAPGNLKLDDLQAPNDNTDLDASITKHGLVPKLPNDAAKYYSGTGVYSVPPGGADPKFQTYGTPSQITANVDNYDPGDVDAARLDMDGNGPYNITGWNPTGGKTSGGKGRRMTLINISTDKEFVLMHDVTSTAANRFLCPGQADYTLNFGDSVDVRYDPTSLRWRVLGVVV